MQCKGCNATIAEGALRMVADWTFCLGCFEALRQPAPHPVTPAVAQTPLTCSACERSVAAGQEHGLGELCICAACHRELISEPWKALMAREAVEASARAEALKQQVAQPRLARSEVVAVGVAGNKTCTTCGRRLIEPGGYKLREGQFFCPACAHAAEAESAAPEPTQAAKELANQTVEPASAVSALSSVSVASAPNAASAASPSSGAATHTTLAQARCDACERALSPDTSESSAGFTLCGACVSVDREAALSIARTRHRALLQALKDRFSSTS